MPVCGARTYFPARPMPTTSDVETIDAPAARLYFPAKRKKRLMRQPAIMVPVNRVNWRKRSQLMSMEPSESNIMIVKSIMSHLNKRCAFFLVSRSESLNLCSMVPAMFLGFIEVSLMLPVHVFMRCSIFIKKIFSRIEQYVNKI